MKQLTVISNNVTASVHVNSWFNLLNVASVGFLLAREDCHCNMHTLL